MEQQKQIKIKKQKQQQQLNLSLRGLSIEQQKRRKQKQQEQQEDKRKTVVELLDSIGISNSKSDSSKRKWETFERKLTESTIELYKLKLEEYKGKQSIIKEDRSVSEFIEFVNNKIKSTPYTSDLVDEVRMEAVKSFGDKQFNSMLTKFTKNNIFNNFIKTLTKYNLEKSDKKFFTEKMKDNHEKLYNHLQDIRKANIGLENYLPVIKIIKLFSKNHVLLNNKQQPLYLNFTITGDPGTGKSVLAANIGKILQFSGILLKSEFSTLESFDFLGEYIGQSAPKTVNTLLENLESVVFIDEAYTLARCGGEMIKDKCSGYKCNKFDQYSVEACTEIVKFISENPGAICIIVAGYENGPLAIKNTFLKINEGLPRRFPETNRIQIKGVSPQDAIQKVKKTLQVYKDLDQVKIINKQQQLGRGKRNSKVYKDITINDDEFLKLFKMNVDTFYGNGNIFKENFSSINMLIKEYIEWITLSAREITKSQANTKLKELFDKHALNPKSRLSC